jgi:hypothetical protein
VAFGAALQPTMKVMLQAAIAAERRYKTDLDPITVIPPIGGG